MISIGVDGWMADFGEALPYYARLFNDQSGSKYHNKFPVIWSSLNKEIVEEMNNSDSIIYFCRSGFTKSPGETSLFWLGDQLTTWDYHDGIKTAVSGLLSSGLSGHSLNHSDIGAYTSIKTPILKHIRSKELFMRWAELNAFTSFFRTHEGNRPYDSHQVYSDLETMRHFNKMTRIYVSLGFYRKKLMQDASEKGLPIARHPFIHFHNDVNVLRISNEQFMLGEEFMIVPVLDKGIKKTKCYLPKGDWVHLWTQDRYNFINQGKEIEIDASIGMPIVFYKYGSEIAKTFLENLEKYDVLE